VTGCSTNTVIKLVKYAQQGAFGAIIDNRLSSPLFSQINLWDDQLELSGLSYSQITGRTTSWNSLTSLAVILPGGRPAGTLWHLLKSNYLEDDQLELSGLSYCKIT